MLGEKKWSEGDSVWGNPGYCFFKGLGLRALQCGVGQGSPLCLPSRISSGKKHGIQPDSCLILRETWAGEALVACWPLPAHRRKDWGGVTWPPSWGGRLTPSPQTRHLGGKDFCFEGLFCVLFAFFKKRTCCQPGWNRLREIYRGQLGEAALRWQLAIAVKN